jgi:hypothetical protein
MTSPIDQYLVVLTGEQPVIRFSESVDEPFMIHSNFWRVVPTPKGLGHALFLNSEIMDDEWRIYSDNIALALRFQDIIQWVLDEELRDTAINVADADFEHTGNVRSIWTEHIYADEEDLALTWYGVGKPVIPHAQPWTEWL